MKKSIAKFMVVLMVGMSFLPIFKAESQEQVYESYSIMDWVHIKTLTIGLWEE